MIKTVSATVALLAGLAGLALLPACSDDETSTPTTSSGGTSTAAATVSVTGSNTFEPATVTVKVGQTVRWNWTGGSHDVISGTSCSPDGKFSSGPVQTSGSFEHQFDAAGTFDYYCTPHCDMGMVGKVIVTN